jgi:hypothetical protein
MAMINRLMVHLASVNLVQFSCKRLCRVQVLHRRVAKQLRDHRNACLKTINQVSDSKDKGVQV